MSAPAAPIDPLGAAGAGVYRDELVEVRSCRGARPRRSLGGARTEHFDLLSRDARVQVRHRLTQEQVDDDLAGMLADELFGPGWLQGAELFERVFTGIVLTSGPDPHSAWELFYRNTLRALQRSIDAGADPAVTVTGHGTIAQYAPVYAHAETLLVPGEQVLELGCCFGFLALRLAAAGWPVTASDLSAGTVGLLTSTAGRLGLGLRTCVADAARYPGPDASTDTVLVLHLLEHLEPDHGDRVVAEAVRLARRRVVVAVPYEDVPDRTWGHVRTVDATDLDRWGARAVASGDVTAYDVHEHHGGWLVLDR